MSTSGAGNNLLPSWWRRWLAAFRRGWPPESHQRLAASLATFRTGLNFLAGLPIQNSAGTSWSSRVATSALAFAGVQVPAGQQALSTWDQCAQHLISVACGALRDGDVEVAWKCYHAACRVELFGLAERRPDALEPRAQAILNESLHKLESWRRRTVVDLLGKPSASHPSGVVLSGPIGPSDVGRIYEASEVLHEHYANEYIKLRSGRQLVGMLSLVAALCMVAVALLGFPARAESTAATGAAAPDTVTAQDTTSGRDTVAAVVSRTAPAVREATLAQGLVPPAAEAAYVATANWPEHVKLALRVVVFGVLGAAFSGLVSFVNRTERGSIPEGILTVTATLARLAAGATGALASYVLLQAGVIPVKPEALDWFALAVAFAAGFSERLVVRTIEGISGEGSKPEAQTAAAETPRAGRT